MNVAPPHVVHDRAPGAQPDARADLDRAPARAADGLARALRPAVQERDAARRLRDRLVHHVPRAGDRRHERVLRRDVERDVDDLRPRPQGRRALPRDARVALRDRALADRALGADRGDPGGRDPARLARARRARAHGCRSAGS